MSFEDGYDDMTPGLEDAAHGEEDLSPELDDDTQNDDSGSANAVGTEGMDDLRKEIAELRKRVANGTKTYQQMQQLQKQLEQEQARWALWKKNGVDPEEIDRIIRNTAGEPEVKVSPTDDSEKPITKAEFNKMMRDAEILREWNFEKKQFVKDHPEFDDDDCRKFLDTAAASIAQEEIDEYGSIQSSAEKIAAKAGARLIKFSAKFENKAAQKVATSRQKVKSQGIVESGHKKDVKTSADEPALTEENGVKYALDYRAKMHAEHQKRMRGR